MRPNEQALWCNRRWCRGHAVDAFPQNKGPCSHFAPINNKKAQEGLRTVLTVHSIHKDSHLSIPRLLIEVGCAALRIECTACVDRTYSMK